MRISQVDFLHSRLLGSAADDLQFNYLTGAGNYNGSQLLKSEPMSQDYERVLDSKVGVQTLSYSAYLPLVFLLNQKTNEGAAIGWDYLGHWRFQIASQEATSLNMSLEIAGFEKDLVPGGKVETPKAFLATFSGGVDELGNQLLDWQYAFMWEFTNPEYFAKTRWAVDWPDPWVGDGGSPALTIGDAASRLTFAMSISCEKLAQIFSGMMLAGTTSGDRGMRRTGNWPTTTCASMTCGGCYGFPTFLATPESKVAQQHPEWRIPGQDILEQSIPATADWQNRLLDESVKSWGEFQWRYDIAPAVSANDTDYLASDQNFRKVLERFKRDHPQSGIDACYGGGRWISYDIARLSESGEYTDGGTGPYSNYYTSLMVSPDKLHNVVDLDHIYYDATSDNLHLALNPAWYRDPGDGPDVESIRKEWEVYHYLTAQGVIGRWSHMFRPKVDHDDAIWYFQRMNRDGSKGVILTKHEKHGATYYVTSRLSKISSGASDQYRGDSGGMNRVTTTSAGTLVTGIYQDLVDGAPRFYGVPGEVYGPLNVKYQSGSGDESLITSIVRPGAERRVTDHFFGMALQIGDSMTVTELGQLRPRQQSGDLHVVSGACR